MTRKQIGAAEVTPDVVLWTRETLGLNQRQMAARLGCYQKSISGWETGKTPPQPLLPRPHCVNAQWLGGRTERGEPQWCITGQ